jgi:hypothetical protein
MLAHRKEYVYLISCPDRPWWTNRDPGEMIDEMVETATEVSYETMLRHCVGLVEWSLSVGYDRTRHQGLTLKADPHVTFNRSHYDGIRCYFLQWSGMEFVWVHELDLQDRGIEVGTPPWLTELEQPLGPRTWRTTEPW